MAENHSARPAPMSMMVWVGTGPIWRPELNTQVSPILSTHEPPSRNGDWWMCPDSTMSGRY